MASVFSAIIGGQLPARFVHRDEEVVAFLSIAPVTAGHTLVVPRAEVDQWTDADGATLARCIEVARRIGVAAKVAFGAPRAALVIAGFEVPHLHVHVFPAWSMSDLDFSQAKPAGDDELDAAATALTRHLAEQSGE